MIKNSPDPTKTYIYQPPTIYVATFYFVLLVWTIISVSYMGKKGWVNWFQLFMVAFVFVMTWYFSLGISYKAQINNDGKLELFSFRRVIRIHSTKIGMVEGPHLPLGFIRFRLEREKAYLFCVVKDKTLQQILSRIREVNPDIKFRNI